jgi:hypothetical protein
MTPEIQQLNQIRLERDLTFDALAAEIGRGVKSRNLARLLTDPTAGCRDRTLFKIREYLKSLDDQAAAAAQLANPAQPTNPEQTAAMKGSRDRETRTVTASLPMSMPSRSSTVHARSVANVRAKVADIRWLRRSGD